MSPTTFRRLTSERAVGAWIGVFIALVAVAIALGAFALSKGFRTDRDVQEITRRVVRVESPSPSQVRRQLDDAIGRLTTAQRRRLLRELIGVATPQQLERLKEKADQMRRGVDARRVVARRDRSPSAATTPAPRPSPRPTTRRPSAPRAPQAPAATPPPAAPPADPSPSAVDVGLPAPLRVCTGLVDVNC